MPSQSSNLVAIPRYQHHIRPAPNDENIRLTGADGGMPQASRAGIVMYERAVKRNERLRRIAGIRRLAHRSDGPSTVPRRATSTSPLPE